MYTHVLGLLVFYALLIMAIQNYVCFCNITIFIYIKVGMVSSIFRP